MSAIGVAELLIISCVLGILLFGVVLLIGVFPYIARNFRVESGSEASVEYVEQLPAEGFTTLDLTNPVGDVEISGEEIDEIVIQAVKIAHGRSTEEAERRAQAIALRIEPAGERLVLAALTTRAQRNERVEWQVRLPARLDVQVEGDVGSVLLLGLRGGADVSTHVGNLRARNCTFVAPTTLRTSSGSIEWEGALASREGSYRVTSGDGAVAISLPAESAFTLDAQTGAGGVQCEFPIEGSSTDQLVGGTFSGMVNGGGPVLTVRSRTGNIQIFASRQAT